MRGRGVKERLKGKDSLREKKAQRVSDRKKTELLREGGKIQREAEIKRIKEERGESDRGRREIHRERGERVRRRGKNAEKE